MADIVDARTRSKMMSNIKGKNTRPERLVRSYLHRVGFRFRLHDRKLPGRPDIILPKYRSVIFVHGCFWHQHEGCRAAVKPKTNSQFWLTKLTRNIQRDAENRAALIRTGWRVFTVWECELNVERLQELAAAIKTK